MPRSVPLWLLPLFVAPASAADGQLWAILVATTKHDDKALDLPYCDRDAAELRRVLLDRGQDVAADRILVISESSVFKPTRATLRQQLAAWLAKPGPNDRVLVFFAGHGELSKKDRRTYLLPRDVNREKLEETGYPLAELRTQLDACPAKVKCLILDCCHAGNDRGAVDTAVGIAAGQIAKDYADGVRNTAVLAGANEDQKSYACNRLRHGIYSFWLCRAMEGAAADEQGRVSIDRLNSYAHDQTRNYSAVEWGKDQTPVRFGKVQGDPVLLTLRPELPETLCRRMAEHLDLEIRRKKLKQVAVAEFLQPTGKGEGLGSGNLTGYSAAQVRQALAGLAKSDYTVWTETETVERLAKVPVAGLGSPRVMRALAAGNAPLDAVVTGVLLPNGPDVSFTGRLFTTSDGRMAEPFKGRLPLSEDLVADLGGSLETVKRPKGDPHDSKVVAFAQQAAEASSPLLAKDFAFPVEVWGRKPGAKEWARKEWVKVPDGDREALVFGVTKGEELRVRVWNRTGNDVACQLSVDGLNTISQARDRVGAGPAWVLSPSVNEQTPSLTCEGWYFPSPSAKIGEIQQAKMNPFVVTDAAESVAGRQRFGEKIGTITAAFYYEKGRKVGIGEGAGEVRPLKVVDFKPGRLAAVVQLRYVDEKELKK